MKIQLLGLATLIAGVGTAAVVNSEKTEPLAAPPIQSRPGVLSTSMERVIVFKDGHGLFVKRAVGVTDAQGRVFTTEVPEAAVLGTFWAAADGAPILSMTAGWHEAVLSGTQARTCLSTAELLGANPGKTVTLSVDGKDVSGRLVGLLQAPASPSPESVLEPLRSKSFDGELKTEAPMLGGTLVVVEGTERGRLVLPVSSIATVAGADLNTRCAPAMQEVTRQKRLTFDFGPAAAKKSVSLRLFYFTPGIRWIPTYRLDTSSGGQAQIALQAELINDEEDVVNAPVDLVVGVPNFKFKDAVSPLSLERAMRATLAPRLGQLSLISTNAYSANIGDADRPSLPARESPPPGLDGDRKQDLFVYSVKSITLKKGARAAVSVWTKRVPQRHVFTSKLTVNRNGMRTGTTGNGLTENRVWHELELSNPTDAPWTTGAALLMQGSLPIAQEILGYTSAGSKTRIPVTVAVDLRDDHSEQEISRTMNAAQIDQRSYARIEKAGTIIIESSRNETSVVQVTLSVDGKVETASNGGRVALNSGDRVNVDSEVTWEVTVAAGEKKKLTYARSYYQ